MEPPFVPELQRRPGGRGGVPPPGAGAGAPALSGGVRCDRRAACPASGAGGRDAGGTWEASCPGSPMRVRPSCRDRGPAGDRRRSKAHAHGWLAEGEIAGVYWLPALDVEPPIAQLDLPTGAKSCGRGSSCWRSPCAAPDGPRSRSWWPGPGWVAGTDMTRDGASAPDGRRGHRVHQGLRAASAPMPWSRPSTSRRGCSPATAAEALLAETLHDPGAVEVGLRRRAALDRGDRGAAAADGGRHRAGTGFGVRGHRRGRKHRLGHRGRPGRGPPAVRSTSWTWPPSRIPPIPTWSGSPPTARA